MKVNPKVYKIDKNHRQLVNYKDTESLCIGLIKSSMFRYNVGFKLEENDYIVNTEDDLWFFLYVFKTEDEHSKWKDFLPKNFISQTDFKEAKISLLLFIEFQEQLYCIIGGSSFRIIQPYLVDNFGIEIYSRILNPEDDELLSIRTRSITGKIAATSNYYKNNFKLIDHIKFGTLPTEISLKLSDQNDYFGFLNEEKANSKVQIEVSNSLKFRKIITFEQFKRIVKEVKYIEELEKSNYLSTYEKVVDSNYIETTLKESLIKRIYKDRVDTYKSTISPLDKFYFEFCHSSKLEQFYEADYFELLEKAEDKKQHCFKTLNDRGRIYYEVIVRAIDKFSENITYDQFKFFLLGVRVRSYKNDNKKYLTSDMFIHHFNTELEIDDNPFFLLDNNWYFLQDSFLKDLNSNCERILKNYKAPNSLITKKWDLAVNNTEKKYNLLYKDLEGYLVFDTIAIEGIELCDILKYDNQNVYLIHVKRGFDSSMRELYNQLILSARRVEEARSSKDKEYLKRCYKALEKKNHNDEMMTFEEFVSLFDKNIKYVMAFSNNSSNERIEDNLKKIKSSIAKFSVIQSSSEMRANYFELLFTQINHF